MRVTYPKIVEQASSPRHLEETRITSLISEGKWGICDPSQWSGTVRGRLMSLAELCWLSVRRAYDRSLLHRALPTATHSNQFHQRAPPNKSPRASYAWEYQQRIHRKPPAPDYPYGFNTNSSWASSHDATQAYRYAMRPDILVGSRRKIEEEDRKIDQLRSELPLLRTFQVTSLLLLAVVVFGGFHRSRVA